MGNQISRKRHDGKSSNGSVATGRSTLADDGLATSSTYSQPKFRLEYCYPNTPIETNRQHNQHYMLKHVFQQSYFAPVDTMLAQPDAHVLDLGCGSSAVWTIDMASDFPRATFYGLDIIDVSESQKNIHVPSNCRFETGDILEGIGHGNETVDYVHQRMMYNAYHDDDIGWVMQEIMRVLKPGGWVDLVEVDIVPKRAGPLFAQLCDGFYQILRKRHKRIYHGPRLRRSLNDAGYIDVQCDYASIPVCWGGYLGKMVYEDLLVLSQHIGPLVYNYLDMEGDFRQAHYDAFIDKAFNECVEYQTFFNIHWASGKKPLEPAT
ncbi:S-adenosyl-L-methionine-dependent methyltransferase [Radiomyces spectabilis]|uniref:S-adenosyl-L-methionine-dependent methyltransferase n=1 Tax=Radiomyces spectabilis TaxID=64574 RepID=UPI00221FB20E|nr:S-adenosyl-L-methionine-dependent methyltransferase [Radiomyces spectabilis]KAI8388218.1 S-adenosyl-L-methionine-dependent methyltransferase [Radiomyces spectabilis]